MDQYQAIADNTWTVLPPGSHLWLSVDGGTRGIDVVAFRVTHQNQTLVVTESGDVLYVDANKRLVVGS